MDFIGRLEEVATVSFVAMGFKSHRLLYAVMGLGLVGKRM